MSGAAGKLSIKLAEIANKMGRGHVNVGFLASATYPDGTPVAAVAFWNEVGSGAGVPEGLESVAESGPSRPPRPFFKQTIAANSPHWGKDLAEQVKSTGGDGNVALGRMGVEIVGEIQESIINFSDPPNAPSTIARKGFDDPLIDTGTMLRSVDFEVEQ